MTDITIDGVSYDLESLSDETKANLASLQFADQEITRLNLQIAALQTARMAYGKAVKDLIENNEHETTDVEISGLGDNITFD